jgi:hypothetical protein
MMSFRSLKLSFFPKKAALILSLALAGCAIADMPRQREETAQRLASPAWMIERDIPAGPFALRAYERIHEMGDVAHIYIEGDSQGIGYNATPKNPVALHLASKDKAENVIWLARPCQYAELKKDDADCPPQLVQDRRYSEEVIQAYNEALSEIAKRYKIRGFHLVGYDGGATIAMLLAPMRPDVLSVRTVAGILDHKAYTDIHAKPPLSGSLNPAEKAADLNALPQYHFIGGQDEVVPPAILHSYMQASPPSACVQSMLIQEAGHDDGWVDKWPELLEKPVNCYSKSPDDFTGYGLPPVEVPQHITVPETPEKP